MAPVLRQRCKSFAVDTHICVHSSGSAAALSEAATAYASQMYAACTAASAAGLTLALLANACGDKDNNDSAKAQTQTDDVPAFVQRLLHAASATASSRARSNMGFAAATAAAAAATAQQQRGGARTLTSAVAFVEEHDGGNKRSDSSSGASSNSDAAAAAAASAAVATMQQRLRAQVPAQLDARLASFATVATSARQFASEWRSSVAPVYAREEVMTQWAHRRSAVVRKEAVRRVQLQLLGLCATEAQARAALLDHYAAWTRDSLAQRRAITRAAAAMWRARVELVQQARMTLRQLLKEAHDYVGALKLREVDARNELLERRARRRAPWLWRVTHTSSTLSTQTARVPPSEAPPPAATPAAATRKQQQQQQHQHTRHAPPPRPEGVQAPAPPSAQGQSPAPRPLPTQKADKRKQLPSTPPRAQTRQPQQQPQQQNNNTQATLQAPLPPLLKQWSLPSDIPVAMSVEEEGLARRSLWR